MTSSLHARGQGSGKLDALTAVVDWVTKDQAPDSLLPTAVGSSGKTTASRPEYLFLYVAENTTGGPADEASSCTPVLSAAEANLTLNWPGSFRSGYESVGNWVHGKWVVSNGKA
jgi:feruloyl esterase